MLQKNKSNRVKYLMLLPLITLFLFSFNVKEFTIPIGHNDAELELSNYIVKHDTIKKGIAVHGVRTVRNKYERVANKFNIRHDINSKSSKKDLRRIRKEFKKKFAVEIKFYDVERNRNKEIIAIKIDGNTLNTASSFFYNKYQPFDKILIAYNKEQGEIYIEDISQKKNKVVKKIKSHRLSSNNTAKNTVANKGKAEKTDTEKVMKVTKVIDEIVPTTIRKVESNGRFGKIKQKRGWINFTGKAYFYSIINNDKVIFMDKKGNPIKGALSEKLIVALSNKHKK